MQKMEPTDRKLGTKKTETLGISKHPTGASGPEWNLDSGHRRVRYFKKASKAASTLSKKPP